MGRAEVHPDPAPYPAVNRTEALEFVIWFLNIIKLHHLSPKPPTASTSYTKLLCYQPKSQKQTYKKSTRHLDH